MREEDKIKAGILFTPSNPELVAIKLKTHNLKHCGSDIAELAALFKLAGITHNNEGYGVGCVSREG